MILRLISETDRFLAEIPQKNKCGACTFLIEHIY